MSGYRDAKIRAAAWAAELVTIRRGVACRLVDGAYFADDPVLQAHARRLYALACDRERAAQIRADDLRKYALPGLGTEDVRRLMRRRGFTHVLTLAGPIPLWAWDPYGNGIPVTYRMTLIDHDLVEDRPDLRWSIPGAPLYLGRWRFIRIEEAPHGPLPAHAC